MSQTVLLSRIIFSPMYGAVFESSPRWSGDSEMCHVDQGPLLFG